MTDDLIAKYVSGLATKSTRIKVSLWAMESPENKQRVINASKMYVASLMFDQNRTTAAVKRKHRARLICRCVSGVFAALAIFFFGYQLSKLSCKNDFTLSTEVVSVPCGQRSMLTLSDGTTVWMNSNSNLKVIEEKGLRKVVLNGEALFDVAKDPKHPFIVHTDKADIKVLGTKFNVSSFSENDLSVKLFDGSVTVVDNEENMCINLQPTEMVSYVDGEYVRSKIDETRRRSWEDGYYSFEDESYQKIVSTICNYMGYKMILKDDNFSMYRCSCTFRIEDGMNHFLKILNLIHPFSYSIDENNKIVTIK